MTHKLSRQATKLAHRIKFWYQWKTKPKYYVPSLDCETIKDALNKAKSGGFIVIIPKDKGI